MKSLKFIIMMRLLAVVPSNRSIDRDWLRQPLNLTLGVITMNISKKILIFVGMFLILIIMGSLGIYLDYVSPVDFAANGQVIEAEWNTNNHNMSLFKIRESNGKVKEWQHYRVTLQPYQIKIGDQFIKDAGSTSCSINKTSIKCVE